MHYHNYIHVCLKVVQIKVPSGEAQNDLEVVHLEMVIVELSTKEIFGSFGLQKQCPQNALVHSATWNIRMGCPEEGCETVFAT